MGLNILKLWSAFEIQINYLGMGKQKKDFLQPFYTCAEKVLKGYCVFNR